MSAPMRKTVLDLEDDIPDIFMIRPCDIYKGEYKECKSVGGRFHQSFTYGEQVECGKWKEDMDLCYHFKKFNDLESALKIIEHEKMRKEARLKLGRRNDVWEYRTEPPESWNDPVDDWVENRQQTVLAAAQKRYQELKEIDGFEQKKSRCVIS